LYCHCAYAKVIPTEVKDQVLAGLAASDAAFETVPDLCEMSAQRDPALQQLAQLGDLRIAACYPRAVRWLFAAAGAPLAKQGVEICNMRVASAEQVVQRLLSPEPAAVEPADTSEGGRESFLLAAAAANDAEVQQKRLPTPLAAAMLISLLLSPRRPPDEHCRRRSRGVVRRQREPCAGAGTPVGPLAGAA
jgi:hypothetical protein